MEKFTRVTGAACPIGQANLNTDQILPARYLKWTRAMGIGTVLFQDLRFDAERKVGFPDQPAGLAQRQGRGRRAKFRLRLVGAKRPSMRSTTTACAA